MSITIILISILAIDVIGTITLIYAARRNPTLRNRLVSSFKLLVGEKNICAICGEIPGDDDNRECVALSGNCVPCHMALLHEFDDEHKEVVGLG